MARYLPSLVARSPSPLGFQLLVVQCGGLSRWRYSPPRQAEKDVKHLRANAGESTNPGTSLHPACAGVGSSPEAPKFNRASRD
jgi:hypothetical protein